MWWYHELLWWKWAFLLSSQHSPYNYWVCFQERGVVWWFSGLSECLPILSRMSWHHQNGKVGRPGKTIKASLSSSSPSSASSILQQKRDVIKIGSKSCVSILWRASCLKVAWNPTWKLAIEKPWWLSINWVTLFIKINVKDYSKAIPSDKCLWKLMYFLLENNTIATNVYVF